MPTLSPEIAPGFPSSEKLINPTIKNNAPNSFTLFQPSMQGFVDLIKENQIKKASLKQLDAQIKNDVKAHRYLNIINKQAQLNQALDKNQRQLGKQMQSILANASLLTEWRSLSQKSFELIQKQSQLAEYLAEEIINEEQVQKFKSLINAELDIFYSEPVRELYRLDFQAILQRGISESDLPYLRDLSQSDNTMHPIIEKEIDNYQTKKENDRENYLFEAAEELIAKTEQLKAIRQRVDFTSSVAVPFVNQSELDEDKPLPPLYTANSAKAVYELLLNGADPVKESQNLEITSLTKHFESRYVIQQELNWVEGICMPSIKTQFNAKFAEQILRQHYSEDKEELKNALNKQIQTLRAEVESQPESQIDLEKWTKELNEDAKQQKLNLKNVFTEQIEVLKNKVNALTPELKKELKSQYNHLKTEAEGLKLELENNTALINAHIKGILLRDVDAQVSDYPDIAGKKEFQQTWNNCKQEINKLQQTQLTENGTAYHFLTEDLAQLPAVEAKTLNSVIKQFPEYQPLLQMQSQLLDNYRLVQGPKVAAKKHVSLATNTVEDSFKAPEVSEINNREVQEAIACEKNPTGNNQLIQPSNLKRKHRLNCALFTGIDKSTESTPTELTPNETSKDKCTGSRLNKISFFNEVNSSKPSLANGKLTHRTICYTK